MSVLEKVYALPGADGGAQIVVKSGDFIKAVADLTPEDADHLEESLRYIREDRERRAASTQ